MVRLVVALFSFSLAVTTTPSRLRLSSLRRALYPVRSLLMMMVLVSVTNPRQETLIVFLPAGTFLIVNRPLSSATAHCSHSTATTVANSTSVLVLLFTTVPEMV